ncbi:MAG: hypothetical protein LC808_05945 [Actinobacteria bacterium]|nr:hypothetical protein [Actinomycetota bacterium]
MKRIVSIVMSLLTGVAVLTTGATSSVAGPSDPKIEDPIIVNSFDGEPIVATLMLPAGAAADNKVPVVLETHGWGGSRNRTPSPFDSRLLDAGYAIFTWDSRGFGDSGGEANIASPQFEVKDAQKLIDYLAGRPEIQLDAPGDPRVGWIGVSNAAGVQFNTAAVDHRIDAIAPEISWGTLTQDLLPNGVYKQGWGELLYDVGLSGTKPDGSDGAVKGGLDSPAGPQTGDYAPQIHQGHAEISAGDGYSQETYDWFHAKSTTLRSGKITTPTLILQGSIDTLFPLEDAFRNYKNLVKAGTPVRLMAYCSGHSLVGCGYPGDASGYPKANEPTASVYQDRIAAWLDKYVKGEKVFTGAEVEWQAQDGYYYRAPRYPLPGTKYVRVRGVKAGRLEGPGATGGDGAADGNPAPESELGSTAARLLIKKIRSGSRTRPMFGIPKVRLTGKVTGTDAQVFLELVDVSRDGNRVTIDDQTMPVKLKTGDVSKRVRLHGVSWLLRPGHKLFLEITTGSQQYEPSRGSYTVDLKAVTKLPLAPPRWARPSKRVS